MVSCCRSFITRTSCARWKTFLISKVCSKLDAQKLNKNELKLATTLVQEMTTTLSEIDTADNYHTALRTLIDSKIKGRQVTEFEEVEEVPQT